MKIEAADPCDRERLDWMRDEMEHGSNSPYPLTIALCADTTTKDSPDSLDCVGNDTSGKMVNLNALDHQPKYNASCLALILGAHCCFNLLCPSAVCFEQMPSIVVVGTMLVLSMVHLTQS